MKAINILTVIILLLLVLGCREGYDHDVVLEEIEPDPSVLVETTIYGRVLDSSNEPIPNAKVFIGNESAFTDDQGVFIFHSIICNESLAVIDVFHSDYTPTHGIVNNFVGDTLSCYLHMNSNENLASFYSHNKPDEIKYGALTLNLSEAEFYDNNANLYNNTVNIQGSIIDAIDRNRYNEHLIGYKDSSDVYLQPIGQFDVHLLDYRKFNQVLLGKNITAQWEISNEQLNNAPTEVFLWQYNQSTKRWLMKSLAYKNGSHYEFELGENGQYALGIYSKMKYLKGKITNAMNRAASALDLQFEYGIFNNSFNLKTTKQGYFKAYLPIENNIDLHFQTQCHDNIKTINVGILEEDILWIDAFNFDDQEEAFRLSGTLLNCRNEPLSAGYIIVDSDEWIGQVALPNENGAYQEIFELCAQENIQIRGYNIEDGSSGVSISYKSNNDINNSIVLSCTKDWQSKMIIDNGNTSFIYDNCTVETQVQGPQILSYFQFEASNAQFGHVNHIIQQRNNAQIGNFWITQMGTKNTSKYIIEEFRSEPFIQSIQDANRDWWIEFEVNNVVLRDEETNQIFQNSRLYYFARRDH